MSRAARTRERILQSTAQLLETGDSAVSMARIAQAAGVTRQLLYVHFDGRAALLVEVSRMVDAEVRTPDLQARVDDAPDARTALRESVALQGHIKARIHPIVTAIDRMRAVDPDAAAAWNERERARYDRALRLVRRLRGEEILHEHWDVTTAARLVWSTTSQRAWSDLVVDAGWTSARWVRHTSDLLERAVCRDP
jgi:AcrR family transcriptional regulator